VTPKCSRFTLPVAGDWLALNRFYILSLDFNLLIWEQLFSNLRFRFSTAGWKIDLKQTTEIDEKSSEYSCSDRQGVVQAVEESKLSFECSANFHHRPDQGCLPEKLEQLAGRLRVTTSPKMNEIIGLFLG
jgi:hypothetical protein